MNRTLEERFWEKVTRGPACWLWNASKKPDGYGEIRVNGRLQLAHRVGYEIVKGPIPPGFLIDHTCHVHACVNPDHLRPVTDKQNAENLLGARSDSKTGVRGVHWREDVHKWRATVVSNHRKYNVGYFRTIQDAERAVIEKRNELFTHNDADRVKP